MPFSDLPPDAAFMAGQIAENDLKIAVFSLLFGYCPYYLCAPFF
jgi:hypothetical protein